MTIYFIIHFDTKMKIGIIGIYHDEGIRKVNTSLEGYVRLFVLS